MTRTHRRVAGLVAVAGAALLALPAAATTAAATTTSAAPVTASRLVLDPTDRGYAGDMRITVRNTTAEPQYYWLSFLEPAAGSWQDLDTGLPCGWQFQADGRRLLDCGLAQLQPGERRTFTADFRVLTRPRPYAMSVPAATVQLYGEGGVVVGSDRFATRFRSTTGSLADPRPYVQDTQSDATLRAGGSATLVRQPDGSYSGRLPVTVLWRGDAPHDLINLVSDDLPAGVYFAATHPDGGLPCFTFCPVPGGAMFPGEVRSFDLVIEAFPEIEPGPLGTVTTRTLIEWNGELPDADPSDNTVTFTLTATA